MRAKILMFSASWLLLALAPLAAQDRDLDSAAGGGAFETAPIAPAPVKTESSDAERSEPIEPGDATQSSYAESSDVSAAEAQAAVDAQSVETQSVETQAVEATTVPQVEPAAVPELPSTASPLALVALFGLGSAGAALGLRLTRRVRS